MGKKVHITIFCEHNVTGGVKKIEEWSKESSASSEFASSENSMDISSEVSGSYCGASASVSASYSEMKKAAKSSSGSHSRESLKKLEFDTTCRALVRVVTTTITVNGCTATEKAKDYVDCYMKNDNIPSKEERRQLSCKYMADRYDAEGDSPKLNIQFETKQKLSAAKIAALEDKWKKKNVQYSGWVSKYGKDHDKNGEFQTNKIVDMVHKLRLEPKLSTVTEYTKIAKTQRDQFDQWHRKHGRGRDDVGKLMWAEFYQDCQALEF